MRAFSKRILVTALSVCWSALAARAEFSAELLERLDRTFQGEGIALAPDGRHLAYSGRNGEQLFVRIVDLVGKKHLDLPVTAAVPESKPSAKLTYLRWATAERLVLETAAGDVIAVDADGGHALKLWNAGDSGMQNEYILHTRSSRGIPPAVTGYPPRILRGDPDDPEHLLLESDFTISTLRTSIPASTLIRINIRDGQLRAMHMDRLSAQSFFLYRGPGRMLYDHAGSPRLFRSKLPEVGNEQRLDYYGETGADFPPRPGVKTYALDRFLGNTKQAEFTFTAPNYLGQHSFPLAFDYDPKVLYYASNVGRDTYGIFSLNLATKVRTEVASGINVDMAGFEPDYPDQTLVFDDSRKSLAGVRFNGLRAQTAWLDPELKEIQEGLDGTFPRKTVELLEWDAARTRILARISAEDDPGKYILANLQTGAVEDVLSLAPWLGASDLNAATEFAFDTPAGVHLTGYVTLPNKPKSSPPPLIIYCQSGLWNRAEPGFNRDTQMLASLGVAVMRLNYRGTAGFGQKHLNAIKGGVDTVPLDDIRAAIDWLAVRYSFDRKRIVMMGQGYGGYLALRAIQLHPDLFRAAISINAPTNLGAWTRANPADGFRLGIMEFRSLTRATFMKGARGGAKITALENSAGRPILVINGDSEDTTMVYTLLGKFGIGMAGTSIEQLLIKGGLENGTPETRAKVFSRIDQFLNERLYDYGADIGDLRVVPDKPAAPKAK